MFLFSNHIAEELILKPFEIDIQCAFRRVASQPWKNFMAILSC